MYQRKRRQQATQNSRSKQAEAPSSRSTADHSVRRTRARFESNRRLQQFLEERSIQPKLTVNAPDDEYEREAERVADAVMRMPGPETVDSVGEEASSLRIQRMCSRCRMRYRQGKPLNCTDCEEELQRREESEEASAVGGELERQIQSFRTGGRPLPASVRGFFEPRFGEDFSDVRVHTGPRADEAARAVNAEAFTLGSDVVFRSANYRPETSEGRRLLAHELTHVVQQTGSSVESDSLQRRVSQHSTNCPGNTNNAPADPTDELEEIDEKAGKYARLTAHLLAVSSSFLEAGLARGIDSEYERAFGLPPAKGGGFVNRLTGDIRPSQDEALSEEMELFSRRFEIIADYFEQSIAYRCDPPITWGGCNLTACNPNDNAGACTGVGAIKICPNFWNHNENAQAGILIHEITHIYWASATHNVSSNLRLSQCYEELVAQIVGFNARSQTCPTP